MRLALFLLGSGLIGWALPWTIATTVFWATASWHSAWFVSELAQIVFVAAAIRGFLRGTNCNSK